MVMLAVVVLGVPNRAAASPPSVQTPTGTQSGGVFSGPYTFGTYISCSGGLIFSSSYSNSLDGTHTFAFWGAADGSLLVSVDGGGLQLLTSCGDPLTGPNVNVANFTVSKNTGPPPTPPPTPTPTTTPTPTPTPPSIGGSNPPASLGGSAPANGNSVGRPGVSAVSTPGPITDAPNQPTPAASLLSPAGTPAPLHTNAKHVPAVAIPATASMAKASKPLIVASATAALAVFVLALVLALMLWRSQPMRNYIWAVWRHWSRQLEPRLLRLRITWRMSYSPHAQSEAKRRGLSPHHHTGRLVAHHHTSYPALAFLLLLSAVVTAGVSATTRADSMQLSLTVLGPPPSVAATIDQPLTGDHFVSLTQTIRGSCPLGLLIELYRNGTFAGSTLCDAGGLYNLVITLTPGQNDLIARDLDGLSQYGPSSSLVSVFYDPPLVVPAPTSNPIPPGSPVAKTATPPARLKPTPAPGSLPFYLDTPAHFYQGADPTELVSWQVQIHGGKPPYQVTWKWGDGRQDISVASTSGDIFGRHRYAKPGAFHVTVRAMDASSREAVISLLAIINGSSAANITRPVEPPGNLVYVWPTLIMMSLVVASFWLGERHKTATTGRFERSA